MENIINKIIEIDKVADDRLKNAYKEKDDIIENAKIEAEKIKTSLLMDAQKRIDEVEAQNKAEYNVKIAELDKINQEEISKIEQQCSTRCKEVERSLIKVIVGEYFERFI